MKIYTSINETSNATYVGTVLTSNDNQLLFKNGFKLTLCDKVSAHLYGLNRTLSFIKHNDLQPENITHLLRDNIRVDIDKEMKDRIDSSEYTQRFINQYNISINPQNSNFTEFDKDMFMTAGLEISPRTFSKDYYR